MERFAAAAAAGFKAVELQFPYEFAPSAVRAELERHGLAMLGINTSPGRREAGEFGLAAVAGREADFAALFRQALDYVVRHRGPTDPLPRRQGPALRRGQRPKRSSSAILRARGRCGRSARHHAADRADQSARPAGLFPERGPSTPPTSLPRSGAPNVRIQFDFYHAQIMGGDLIAPLREVPAGDRPRPDRRGALAPRARRRRGELSRRVCGARSARLWGLDRLRIQIRAREPRTGSPGRGRSASRRRIIELVEAARPPPRAARLSAAVRAIRKLVGKLPAALRGRCGC